MLRPKTRFCKLNQLKVMKELFCMRYAARSVTSDPNMQNMQRYHAGITSAHQFWMLHVLHWWRMKCASLHRGVLLRCSPHAKMLHGPTLILQLITPQQFLVFCWNNQLDNFDILWRKSSHDCMGLCLIIWGVWLNNHWSVIEINLWMDGCGRA